MTLITQQDDPKHKPDPKPKNAAEAKVAAARAEARARRQAAEEEAEVDSGFSMMNIRGNVLQSKAVKGVLWLLIFIFAVGGFIFSALPGNDAQNGGNPMAGSGPDPIAQSGEVAISRDEFNRSYEQQVQMATMYGQSPDATNLLTMRGQALQGLLENASQVQAARDAGITVSGEDVDKKINEYIDEQIKSAKSQGAADFRRQLESQNKTEESFREELRTELNTNRDAIERSLLVEKFQKSIADANKVTEDDYKKSVTKLQLRQIAISPETPKPGEKDVTAATAKANEAAKARAERIAQQLKAAPAGNVPALFAQLAKKESADTATKDKGGVVGWKTATELPVGNSVKEALTAATGNLVGPVQDDFSKQYMIFHIGGRKLELPKDYSNAAKKKEYLTAFETQRDNEVWAKKQEEIRKNAKTEIYDPALAAYKIQTEQALTATGAEAEKLRQQAIEEYQKALQGTSGQLASAINFQLAQLYGTTNQPKQRLEALQAAAKESETPAVKIELARALREDKKPAEALKQLDAVAKELGDQPSAGGSQFGADPTMMTRFQLASEYDELGKKDLAAKQRKLATPPAPPAGAPGAPGAIGGSPNIQMIPPGSP